MLLKLAQHHTGRRLKIRMQTDVVACLCQPIFRHEEHQQVNLRLDFFDLDCLWRHFNIRDVDLVL